MKRIFPTLLVLWLSVFAYGQSNPKVKEMEVQRNLIEQQISESKRLLSTTQKNVEGQLAQLSALSAQIKKQKAYIERIDADVKALDRELTNIEEQLKTLQIELERRRQHYAYALQKMVHKNTFENRLMFIFSAESFNQMIRRMRYLREYSTFQHKQGELLLSQQKELDQKRNELEQTREAKKGLLAKRLEEKKELDHQEAEQRKIVNNLKKQQKDIRSQIAKQQREREKLNQQIEKIIEAEIAAQREEQRKKETKSGGTTTSTKSGNPMPAYKENAADKKLTGSFESNKGRLPIPISGPYLMTSHYGVNYVEGLKNVKFNNQGVDIRGQANCHARAVFDGTVSFIFEHPQIQGSYIVMIRHGQYISAYFNLVSLKVKKGDKVSINESIGLVRPDASGNYTMQFQLRKGTESLNPELWIPF